MGIDYRAAIFVGLPRESLYQVENFEELLDSDELQVCPPHYDGNGEDYAIVGYEVYGSDTHCASEFVYDQAKIAAAKEEFKLRTGLDAKVWISPYGY